MALMKPKRIKYKAAQKVNITKAKAHKMKKLLKDKRTY